MPYQKTYDVWVIYFHGSYGAERVNEYSYPDYDKPYQSARADLKEYRLSNTGCYTLKKERRPL